VKFQRDPGGPFPSISHHTRSCIQSHGAGVGNVRKTKLDTKDSSAVALLPSLDRVTLSFGHASGTACSISLAHFCSWVGCEIEIRRLAFNKVVRNEHVQEIIQTETFNRGSQRT
jgi:hypothetical protein